MSTWYRVSMYVHCRKKVSIEDLSERKTMHDREDIENEWS